MAWRVMAVAVCFLFTSGEVMAFDIEAHRGGRALLPENTLVSFANALSMGVDTLELDVGVTADGELVVSHERGLNPDLARGADGAWVAPPGIPFVRLKLSEIKKYDVGRIRPDSEYARQFPDQHAMPGTPIPTLREVFALVRKSGDEHVRLNIETKIDPNHPDQSPAPDRFVALLLDLLAAEKFESRVTVQSFDWRTLALVQQRAPAIPTVYLTIQRGKAPTVSLQQRHRMDRRLQSRRARRLAAGHHQARRRRDLVALFRRRHAGAGRGIPSSRAQGRGLDREQKRRHRAPDRSRRRRHHLRSPRLAARGGGRKRHRPAEGISGDAVRRATLSTSSRP